MTLPIGEGILNGERVRADASVLPFPVDGEVVLFLQWWAAFDTYTVAFGSAGVFHLSDASAAIPHSARRIAEFSAKSSLARAVFLNVLKAACAAD